MAGSRHPGPIGEQFDPLSLHGGILSKAPPALPGPVTSVELVSPHAGNIVGRFTFREWSGNDYHYVQASGELGVPGEVVTHRDERAQRQVSAGTGEHAGHLIAIQFGAPGDSRNLGLQNPNMNTYAPRKYQEAFVGTGGSYYKLEATWKELLLDGWKIEVIVTDKYRLGEDRPFTRSVSWTGVSTWGEKQGGALDFGNFDSPQKRAAEA
ncbi:MAG: hypothetical protein ABR987_02255 [Terracidiphilus sp.]